MRGRPQERAHRPDLPFAPVQDGTITWSSDSAGGLTGDRPLLSAPQVYLSPFGPGGGAKAARVACPRRGFGGHGDQDRFPQPSMVTITMNEALRPFTKDRSHLDFRVATAVWGTVLVVTLLVTSGASWTAVRDGPGPFGEGPLIGRTVWSLASFQPTQRSDPRRWWARLAVVCLVATVLLGIGAATTAGSRLARLAGVAAGLTVVSVVIVGVAMHDDYFRPAAGLYAAGLVAAALVVWAFIVAANAGEHDSWPDAG